MRRRRTLALEPDELLRWLSALAVILGAVSPFQNSEYFAQSAATIIVFYRQSFLGCVSLQVRAPILALEDVNFELAGRWTDFGLIAGSDVGAGTVTALT